MSPGMPLACPQALLCGLSLWTIAPDYRSGQSLWPIALACLSDPRTSKTSTIRPPQAQSTHVLTAPLSPNPKLPTRICPARSCQPESARPEAAKPEAAWPDHGARWPRWDLAVPASGPSLPLETLLSQPWCIPAHPATCPGHVRASRGGASRPSALIGSREVGACATRQPTNQRSMGFHSMVAERWLGERVALGLGGGREVDGADQPARPEVGPRWIGPQPRRSASLDGRSANG